MTTIDLKSTFAHLQFQFVKLLIDNKFTDVLQFQYENNKILLKGGKIYNKNTRDKYYFL